MTAAERALLLERIRQFDERAKLWSRQEALAYLVRLGTHDAAGNLTPEYGGAPLAAHDAA